MADYQGWRNSATFLTNQYLQQEASLYEQIVALQQAGVRLPGHLTGTFKE